MCLIMGLRLNVLIWDVVLFVRLMNRVMIRFVISEFLNVDVGSTLMLVNLLEVIWGRVGWWSWNFMRFGCVVRLLIVLVLMLMG